jgi:hypothetical protein
MTPRNFEENFALYDSKPDIWQVEADKMGNGWMRFQIFELGVNAWLDSQKTSQPQRSSLSQTDSGSKSSV